MRAVRTEVVVSELILSLEKLPLSLQALTDLLEQLENLDGKSVL